MTAINIEAACRRLAGSDTQAMIDCISRTHSALLSQYWTEITKGFSDPDGITTISDIYQILASVMFFPGNLTLYFAAKFLEIHDFFEMSVESFNGFKSLIISFIFMFVCIRVMERS